jgi:hypothetical protein
MELNTLFLGVIAFCMLVLTVVAVVFLINTLRVMSSLNEKLSVITFELSEILPSVRKSAKSIELLTSVFGILKLFSSGKSK